jgi:ribosomal protein L11 methyltransferase
MTAAKLAIRTDDRTLAHHVAAVFTDLFEPSPTAVTVFENPPGWLVEAYYDGAPPNAEETARTIGNILGIDGISCEAEVVPDENWVARSQEALPPVYAGRYTIYGSHDRGRVGRGWNTIQIDAGEAFGTAHHATTYGCLVALDKIARERTFRSVLDLGTGSGVLALALQRAQPHASLIATDLDQRSIEVARDNAAQNALTGPLDQRLRFLCTAGLAHPQIRAREPFDLVIANILAGPLIGLAPKIARHTRIGGTVLLSGILVRQAAEVCARYVSLGFGLERHDRYEEWSTLILSRRA